MVIIEKAHYIRGSVVLIFTLFMSAKRINSNKDMVLRTGTVIPVITAILPYAFYYYEAPSDRLWGAYLFKSLSNSFNDNKLKASWGLIQKLVPLILLLIWFFTAIDWWYHTIMIPISLYAFQLYNLFDFSAIYVYLGELYFTMPVVIISLSLAYLVQIKVFDKIHGIDISEIEVGIKKPSDR